MLFIKFGEENPSTAIKTSKQFIITGFDFKMEKVFSGVPDFVSRAVNWKADEACFLQCLPV